MVDQHLTKICDLVISDKSYTIQGWIESIRIQSKWTFMLVRNGPGTPNQISVVASSGITTGLKQECFVRISGYVKSVPSNHKSVRQMELHADTIETIGKSKGDSSAKCPPNAGIDCQLTQRHFYLRQSKPAIVTALNAILLESIREHFKLTGSTEICPPMFVANQCEGGATLFKLEYPDTDSGSIDAYLTQSSQFYLEYSLPAVGDCYCISPSFRAEKSHTRRHLTEFLHAECEWQGIFTLQDHLDKLQYMLSDIVSRFFDKAKDLLQQLNLVEHVSKLVDMTQDIQILTHAEAIQYCRQHNIYKDYNTLTHFDVLDDIPEMQERQMIDQIGKIVFLTKFPKHFKSFYFALDDDDTVQGCDVEVPGVGEIIGSGVREYDYDRLVENIKTAKLNMNDYTEYLDLRLYGSARTSGMGLGVGRLLTWLLNAHSIREVVDYPRVPGRLNP